MAKEEQEQDEEEEVVESTLGLYWSGSGQLQAGIQLQSSRTVPRETLVLHYRGAGPWVQGDEGVTGHRRWLDCIKCWYRRLPTTTDDAQCRAIV